MITINLDDVKVGIVTAVERTLSANEVAKRLGVELATVYAYASRGSLTRRPTPGSRRSSYDADEVEELARRSRPRSVRRRTGAVDVIIGTTISEISDGWIHYRDRDLAELAGAVTFEQVAHLLWTGEAPDRAPASWPRPADRSNAVTSAARRATAGLASATAPSARLAVAAAAASSLLPVGALDATLPGPMLIHALVAALPLVGPTEAPAAATVARRLWPRFSPLAATPARVAALDLALVLLAEHELATSTLAVRVAASTGAGPAEALVAGLGAVSGPLHGRAAVRVHQRILAGADGPMDGFGHVVHRSGDPRYALLRAAVAPIASARRWAAVEADLDRQVRAGADRPNVDAALGALGFVARARPGATEAVFAVARSAGWLAHAFEEADEPPLRFRGRTLYRGPRP